MRPSPHAPRRRIALLPAILLLLPLASGCGAEPLGEGAPPSSYSAALAEASLGHLRAQGRLAGIGGERALRLKGGTVDELGMSHSRWEQHLDGVPVWGAEVIVHLRRDGSLFTVTDGLVRSLRPTARPRLGGPEAIRRALDAHGCAACLTEAPAADLWILRHGEGDHYAYRVQLRREDGTDRTSLPVYFVDAADGAILLSYDNLQTGTGVSLYSGTVTIDSFLKGKSWYLEGLPRKIGTFDMRSGSTTYYRFTDANNVWDSATQKAGVDVQFGIERAFDYFKNVHGRVGFDGAGGPGYYLASDGKTRLISARAHYGSKYANASWNGSYFNFGDGDGVEYGPLVPLDVCGHEATHAVIDTMAPLIYYGESGALNEGISDIFGAMIERYVRGASGEVWKLGEQCYTPGNGTGDAIRYMATPHAASDRGYTADDDPDHYSERYTGGGDNGGVHVNSGIVNQAFFLLAQGGSHHLGGSMTGIGADAAAAIWFKALASFMTPSTTFAGARRATLDAAAALHGAGSPQQLAVDEAWRLVGVVPAPPDGEKLTNGGFESTADPWALEGSAWHTTTGAYPHGGSGYVFLGNGDYAQGAVYGDLVIQPSWTSANLTFWLEVTTAETDPGDYDLLKVEVRDAGGFVLQTLGTYSNRNAGTPGAYTQIGPFDLLPYQGQLVRLQFTATTDYAAPTTFRLDDVSLR